MKTKVKTVEVEARAVRKGDHLAVGGLCKVLEVRPPGRTKHMRWEYVAIFVVDPENYPTGRALHCFLPRDKVSIRKR